MNQKNYRIERLAMLLETLEEYIRRAEYYSDWKQREKFYNRTIPINEMISLEIEEDWFFSNFSSHFCAWEMQESKNHRQAFQKEFYKWIDYSGITAKNCPEKLKHFLNEINEVLENGRSQLHQDYEVAKEKYDIFTLTESPFFVQASQEVNKALGFKNSSSEEEQLNNKPKFYTAEIKGNAEQGQKTFQEIKNSIVSQPEWNFTFVKKHYQALQEKIKELEAKKDQRQPIQPKENWKPGYIIDTFTDILEENLELYIQKLDYYPNWKAHEWERKEDQEHWEKKSVSEVEGLSRVGLKTMAGILGLFKSSDPDYYPILIDELKSKFLIWQKEKKVEINNSPHELREILLKFNEVLDSKKPWEKMKDEKSNKNENKEEELTKIIVEIKFEIAGLKKNMNLGSEFNDLENKLKHSKNVSEARDYQQQIKQKIDQEKKKQQELDAANENKLSLPVKLAIGVGIVLLIIGAMFIVRQVIKNQKVKK